MSRPWFAKQECMFIPWLCESSSFLLEVIKFQGCFNLRRTAASHNGSLPPIPPLLPLYNTPHPSPFLHSASFNLAKVLGLSFLNLLLKKVQKMLVWEIVDNVSRDKKKYFLFCFLCQCLMLLRRQCFVLILSV